MNTPAHIVFSLALLGRKNSIHYVMAITAGALFPDLMMIVFYGYERLMRVPESIIWGQHYYLPAWQNLFDITNSIPLFGLVCAIAAWYARPALALFSGSALIHCALDLLVHHEDSHRHFYPFSDFRFFSPVSYWNPAHYGNVIGLLEVALFTLAAVYLWLGQRSEVSGHLSMTRLRVVIIATACVYLVFFLFVALTWMD